MTYKLKSAESSKDVLKPKGPKSFYKYYLSFIKVRLSSLPRLINCSSLKVLLNTLLTCVSRFLLHWFLPDLFLQNSLKDDCSIRQDFTCSTPRNNKLLCLKPVLRWKEMKDHGSHGRGTKDIFRGPKIFLK